MTFEQDKKNILGKKDKSFIGEIDKPIQKLVNLINSKPDFYTTSSCSGRVVLIKAREKKEENLFVWTSHDKIELEEFASVLKRIAEEYKDELIYFKMEPCLIVVAARNLEKGYEILKIGREKIGMRRSGIMTAGRKVIVEIMANEKLELPLIDKGKILVDEEFLKLLIKEANKKLEKGWGKIKVFEEIMDNDTILFC